MKKLREIIIKRTVKNRIQKWNRNQVVLHNYTMESFYSAMKEISLLEMRRKQMFEAKNWNICDAFNHYSVSYHVGYRYGVLLANNLLEEKNFNLYSLKEFVKRIPQSYVYWNIYSRQGYMEGFISGIFAEDHFGEDLHYFINLGDKMISDWKHELMQEGTASMNKKEKEVSNVSLTA